MVNKLSIAIIGGGASGSLTALHLLKALKQPAEIFLIEKEEAKLFRGAAYGSDLEYEPLNVPAEKMGIYSDRPDDFYNWLKENIPGKVINPDSFVSRRWFGNYLEERVKEAFHQKREEVSFEIISSATKNISKPASRYSLTQEDGRVIDADIIVLATGNESPADVLPENATQLLGDKYVLNPWEGDALKGIRKEDNVLIIGTGLTMADHVISLHKRGHAGKITALSRNGLLPKTHGVTVPYQLQKDITSADFYQFYENLCDEIENAATKNINWISVFDAIRGITPKIWCAFSYEAKKTFLEKYRAQWEIHRHRLPQASAETLQQLLSTGQLEIVPGTVTGVRKVLTNFIVQYRHSFSWNEERIEVQHVINCTGPSGNYENGGNALFRNLFQQGWLKKDDFNLGIVTGPRGEIVQRNGGFLPSVFAIGPLRKASEWESIAIPEIRKQAEQLAGIIVEKAKSADECRRVQLAG